MAANTKGYGGLGSTVQGLVGSCWAGDHDDTVLGVHPRATKQCFWMVKTDSHQGNSALPAANLESRRGALQRGSGGIW